MADAPPSFLRTRRDFLRTAGCAALGTFGMQSMLRDLRLVSSALAHEATTLTDYKALVCIFLAGGNDSNNLIVPTGTDYSNYAAVRQNLAIPELSLLGINPLNSDGRSYGFHPACYELQALFGEGKLGLVFNVGTLLYPTSRAQYQARSVALPPQLFSHSDQVTHWMTSIPDQPARTGWGGRIADLLHPLQYELQAGVPTTDSAKVAMCVSLAGANTFEAGNVYQQYHVSTTGAVTLSNITGARLQAMKDVLALSSPNLQRAEYAGITTNAIETGDLLNAAISPTVNASFWTTPFPGSSLGSQLRMVARMIEGRDALNMKRQIFFCQVGGYDTHTAQVGNNQNPGNPLFGPHTDLLNELSESIYAFQRATEQLGVSDKVTSFTASDFGRTFPTNGQGSDHGWGSHHLIVGGAVRGQRTYGTFPVLQVSGPDDTSTGRWIPKLAVDQYAGTLAHWFGVGDDGLGAVFPYLNRFPVQDLGFML